MGWTQRRRRFFAERMVSTGIRKSHSNRYDGRWWEFQANQAMGAALLPRKLVEVALDSGGRR